jgi:hypothetical protein
MKKLTEENETENSKTVISQTPTKSKRVKKVKAKIDSVPVLDVHENENNNDKPDELIDKTAEQKTEGSKKDNNNLIIWGLVGLALLALLAYLTKYYQSQNEKAN